MCQLPGVTAASMGAASGDLVTLTVESVDLRATTQALLALVRARGLTLVNMRAEPVTLTEVFTALTRRQQTQPPTAAQSAESGERG